MYIDTSNDVSPPRRPAPAADPGPVPEPGPPGVRSLPLSMQCLLGHRNVLLLQGPMGGFFATLARRLEARGQRVHKIHFNGGDWLFYRRRGATRYEGSLAGWPQWLARFAAEHGIEAVVVFGQMRPLHRAAKRVADELGLAFYVFEEGYLRPDYVTLERDGVNAHSSMPRDAATYRALPAPRDAQRPQPTAQRFWVMAWIATLYCLASFLLRPWFCRVPHHRPLHPLREALCWLRGGWRKLRYGWQERHVLRELRSEPLRRRWFLVPLQVHNDSQVRFHSPFESVEDFVVEVMRSFAAHAAPDAQLVFKHHPMDRDYTDYTRLVAAAAAACGIAARVRYVHDLHLPTLLQHARGVVTINSTTGLQALFHGTPVIALGDCFYAIDGLTCQRDLAGFWRAPGRVDRELYRRFRAYMTEHTQLNASFYGRAPALDTLAPAPAPRTPAVADPIAPAVLSSSR